MANEEAEGSSVLGAERELPPGWMRINGYCRVDGEGKCLEGDDCQRCRTHAGAKSMRD